MSAWVLLKCFCILTFATYVRCYYISSSMFTYEDALKYCQNYCQSEIASIHNESQFKQAKEVINNQSIIFADTDIYIVHSYNLNISATNCIVLDSNNNWQWKHAECNISRRVLCNHCDGKLNKYIIIRIGTYFQQAKSKCLELNTSLASIHTTRDFEEMQMLCNISAKDVTITSCWIGLTNNNQINSWTNAEYLDNTTFDFGSQSFHTYPWGNSEPQNDPIQKYVKLYAGDSFLLHDDDEHSSGQFSMAICNRPSELCGNFYVYGNANIYNCELFINYSHDSISNGISSQVWQWYNTNGILRIDVNMKITFSYTLNIANSVEIVIGSCKSKHYLMRIAWYNDIYYTTIGYWNGQIVYEGVSPRIPDIDSDIYYTLSIQIERLMYPNNALIFNLSINNIQYAYWYHNGNDIIDENILNINKNGYSGVIGIHSQYCSIHVKSLYISGNRLYTNELQKCNYVPSYAPTALPTMMIVNTSLSITKTDDTQDIHSDYTTIWILFIIIGILLCCAFVLFGCILYKRRKIKFDKYDKRVKSVENDVGINAVNGQMVQNNIKIELGQNVNNIPQIDEINDDNIYEAITSIDVDQINILNELDTAVNGEPIINGQQEGNNCYEQIEKILKNCDEFEWSEYLNNFQKHKLTDMTLKQVKYDNDKIWDKIIPEIGIQIKFKNQWFDKIMQNKQTSKKTIVGGQDV
eukprot:336381_1